VGNLEDHWFPAICDVQVRGAERGSARAQQTLERASQAIEIEAPFPNEETSET